MQDLIDAVLIVLLAVGIFLGASWLITVCAGFFGADLTLWQGMVTAFTLWLVTHHGGGDD